MAQDHLVLFWFDVEDYITPEADDALLEILRMFDDVGVQGIFKLVGEKFRVLKARNRREVLDRLTRLSIGYHTDFHSRPPTVSEYLAERGLEDGVDEFMRREGRGFEEIRAHFGRIWTYGQPGGSWAPQVYLALRRWGVPTYIDSGGFVGLNDAPHYYMGILNLYRLGRSETRVSLRPGVRPLEEACDTFRRLIEENRPGRVVSIVYHPCEFVTSRFWDEVNFARGAHPRRDQWKPALLLPSSERERRLGLLREYVRFIAEQEGVRVATAEEVVEAFGMRPERLTLSHAEALDLVQGIGGPLSYRRVEDRLYTAAEQLACVAWVLSGVKGTFHLPSPLGPDERCATTASGRVAWDTLVSAARFVRDVVVRTGRLPGRIPLGDVVVSPETFLCTAALAARAMLEQAPLPDEVPLIHGELLLSREVPERMDWSWIPFPAGFEAPRLLELARLQTWTLVPAERLG